MPAKTKVPVPIKSADLDSQRNYSCNIRGAKVGGQCTSVNWTENERNGGSLKENRGAVTKIIIIMANTLSPYFPGTLLRAIPSTAL